MTTCRDLIAERSKEIRAGDLTPLRAGDLLGELTSLLGTVLEEIRTTDVAYNEVLLSCLDSEEAANRAVIRSKVSPEYLKARIAKDTHTVLMELIRSLKLIIRAMSDEMKLTPR